MPKIVANALAGNTTAYGDRKLIALCVDMIERDWGASLDEMRAPAMTNEQWLALADAVYKMQQKYRTPTDHPVPSIRTNSRTNYKLDGDGRNKYFKRRRVEDSYGGR